MPKNITSEVKLTNRNYLAEAKMRNHFVMIDEPVNKGGDDNAPTPVEYLLTAIGGCVSMTLRMYAEKKNWDLGEITVKVSQKQALTSEGIKKSLVEEISFEKEVTEEQREKLLAMADQCPIAKMIKGETEISSKII
ncbi:MULTISPECIES: OsmC family protein [unclassified Tenacibaculum]|uniref:OsmC family protein n=1 Tax=unclassified Tenacibaculum TaxID=2635139 RepID=UPI001F17E547|nr:MULTISPECIES: OsmC family protein [unclassified Tenacibaculum]MCF2874018.1 OsmC family protein [Tenacibaculum sp. Cn5-1]MCF2934599.1 OsmC family protein [Tenacibaculum sp. Cn5-34]MCG7510809.1 OsmC family protein [Tenacibaculum sp. Cn5-46]